MSLSRSKRHRKEKKGKGNKSKLKRLFPAFGLGCLVILGVVLWQSKEPQKLNTTQELPEKTMSTPVPITKGPGSKDTSNLSSKEEPSDSVKKGIQVKLSFVGDVLLASTVETIMKKNGYDYPYSVVKTYLQKPDLTIANLETPVTDRGTEQKKEYVYRSSPLALPALVESGVDLVNLANNHVMDYGAEGLLDTMEHLDQAGLKHVGAGKDADEAYRPVIIEKQGVKIAFLGFSRVVPEQSWKAGIKHPGVAETYSYTIPVEAIKKAKEQADLVVVIAHWGSERKDRPETYQTDLAHRYIDAGADLIVGCHPHVLQGFENYKGKWIAYSMGNFVFTTNNIPKTWETVILEAACTKEKSCELHVVPILNKGSKPEPMSSEHGSQLLERLTEISLNAKVAPDGQVLAPPDVSSQGKR